MIRKQIYLTKEANQRLMELSKRRNVSQAEVIREGLEKYLDTITEDEQQDQWDNLIRSMRQSELTFTKWNRDEEYSGRNPIGGNDERTD